MPIPRELLKAVFAALPEDKVRAAAHHCFDRQPSAEEMVAELRGVKIQRDSDQLSVSELVEKLSSDDGHYLQMITSGNWLLSIPDLRKIYPVLGIDADPVSLANPHYEVWNFVFGYDKRQEREEFHGKSGVARMTVELLRAEVHKMAKPCIHLTRNSEDGPFAGLWGGPGIAPAPAVDPTLRPERAESEKYRHWITLNCNALPEEFAPLGLRGTASIYSDEWCGWTTSRNENEAGWVAIDPECVFFQSPEMSIRRGDTMLYQADGDGVPLFARPGLSYPSQFQIIDYATPTIRDWLTKMGYTFKEGDYYSLPVKELKDVYDAFIFDLNPIFKQDSGIVAVVGGWTIDMEYTYAALFGDRCYQLVFTLEDSEPWIQAVTGKTTGKHYVRQLIT